jgi:hypothetical protein
LPEQPKTNDCDNIAQLHIRRANPVQSHGSERSERSLIKAQCRIRMNPRRQQPGNTSKLRVHSVARSGTSHTITHVEIGNALSNSDNRPRTAVAESNGLIESAANCCDCREHAIALNFVDDFANQVRTRFGLLHQVLIGEFT